MKLHKTNLHSDALLDPTLADRMLQNVFTACGDETNSVPLEILTSCANYQKEGFRLQKYLLIAIIILFLLLPLWFISPKINIVENAVPEYPSICMIQVESLLPVQNIRAVLNGKPLYVTRKDSSTYYINAGTDGELTVTVILSNRQYTTETIQIISSVN